MSRLALGGGALILEVELRCVPQDPRGIGRLLTLVRDEVAQYDTTSRLWYMRSSAETGAIRLGIHSSWGEQPDLLECVMRTVNRHSELVTLTAHTARSNFQDALILKRIPWATQPQLSLRLLNCFLAGTEVALSFLADGPNDIYKEQESIAFLCYLAERCFRAATFSAKEAMSYATFHRDSIVRFIVLRAGKGLEKACEVINLLEANARSGSLPSEVPGMAVPFSTKLADSISHWLTEVVSACNATEYEAVSLWDPFAATSQEVILFQQIHMMAHQLGLSLLAEAQALTFVRAPLEQGQEAPDFTLTLPPLEEEPPSSASLQISPISASRPPWMVLVEAGSKQGRALMERFRSEFGSVYHSCSEALAILRRHQLGEQRFETAIGHLDAARSAVDEASALNALMARFFWGSLAYYQYCRGNLAQAEDTLNVAGEQLNKAINLEACLFPCAPLNSDIPLQRARIARRQGNWPKVARELSLLADLECGRRPLLQRDDGIAITYTLLERRYLSRSISHDPEIRLIYEYLDPGARMRRLNDWLRSFYLQNGIIVSC